MSTEPLVSILMPCYNARESLPWAIASCLAQTYENWELVLVDDGSTDNPGDVVRAADDVRIRLITLPENKGRGYARQVALDNAQGAYICMLDADDWMYPDRIERQVSVIRQCPEVALVSAGLAISDLSGGLAGVRSTGSGEVLGPLRKYYCPVAHAVSMFRREVVSGLRYNPTLRFGEDVDFLARILCGRKYLVLPEPLYAYEELNTVSSKKSAENLKYAGYALRANVTDKCEVAARLSSIYFRQAIYTLGSFLHMDRVILQRRSRKPLNREIRDFQIARQKVRAMFDEHFG